MDEVALRVVIVGAVVGLALAAAAVGRRRASGRQPLLDLRGSGLDDDIVIFTSTDCSNCASALAALKARDLEFREVTWELEPARMESIGVAAVPLIVFRDPAGETVSQLGGVPKRRALDRSLAAMHKV